MYGREQTGRPYPQIGIPEPHHPVTHHQNDPLKMAKCVKIQQYHLKLFAEYLEKLRNTPDGDGSLLDRTPVEASWLGFPMSQFDKDDVEHLGLLKLDVLGISRIEAGFPRVSPEDAEAIRLILRAGLKAEIAGQHVPFGTDLLFAAFANHERVWPEMLEAWAAVAVATGMPSR